MKKVKFFDNFEGREKILPLPKHLRNLNVGDEVIRCSFENCNECDGRWDPPICYCWVGKVVK